MELLQIKYFQYAAKKENITHAAQSFMVPPSSVSVSIKKLEQELGVTLFDRTSNSLKLSECGRIFLKAIENADREFKKAKIEMLNLSDKPRGEIKLLILTNRRVVTDVIAKFRMDYPDVTFSIKHEDYDDYASYSNYDVIISDRTIEAANFTRRDFVHEEVFLAVPAGSALAAVNGVSLKNISGEKFICMPKGSSHRDFMDRWFRKSGIGPEIVIECDDPYYICEYLKMGLGNTFFPSVSWGKQFDERLKLLRINDGIYRHSYMYINNESSYITEMFSETLELSQRSIEHHAVQKVKFQK